MLEGSGARAPRGLGRSGQDRVLHLVIYGITWATAAVNEALEGVAGGFRQYRRLVLEPVAIRQCLSALAGAFAGVPAARRPSLEYAARGVPERFISLRTVDRGRVRASASAS